MSKIIGNTTATPNPQPDWNQTNEAKADYIKNKPTVLSEDEIIGLIGEHGPDAQIQSDWNQIITTEVDYIKNKPTLGALAAKSEVSEGDLEISLKTKIDNGADNSAVEDLAERVEINEAAISTLNGTGEGSVDKKINDAFNEFATNVSDDKTVNTYKELIDYAATHGPEFTELVGKVDSNTKAIAKIDTSLASVITFEEISSDETTKNVQLKFGADSLYPQTTAANVIDADYSEIAFDVAEMISYEE